MGCLKICRKVLKEVLYSNYLALLSLHNIHFMVNLMTKIRKSLENDTLLKVKKNFLKNIIQKKVRIE
ncbi:MAG: queuine tRNA-ribosyltransferase family protein [Endomicrobium sp.]|nr:queuine tRNA-ribosyltransferase family protein [Endomicrobium sp.]